VAAATRPSDFDLHMRTLNGGEAPGNGKATKRGKGTPKESDLIIGSSLYDS
jgi:hypothetical protein